MFQNGNAKQDIVKGTIDRVGQYTPSFTNRQMTALTLAEHPGAIYEVSPIHTDINVALAKRGDNVELTVDQSGRVVDFKNTTFAH